MAGKPVDIILTVTGKGLRAELQGKPNSVVTGQSSNWGLQDQ